MGRQSKWPNNELSAYKKRIHEKKREQNWRNVCLAAFNVMPSTLHTRHACVLPHTRLHFDHTNTQDTTTC